MIYSWQLASTLAKYMVVNKRNGRKRFPTVMMLEPNFNCNLACAGCGRIRQNADNFDEMLTAGQCLAAMEEAQPPVVSITGGEPLLHPEILRIVEGIVTQKRFVYLCTNGLLLRNFLSKVRPSPYLGFVVHLDGLALTHEGITGRAGLFETAVNAIRAAKQAGFQVRTNTTIYKSTDPQELVELFTLLGRLGVDGIMVAPAFSYEKIDSNIFLSRQEAMTAFQPIYAQRAKLRFYNTPVYLDFLAGRRTLQCTPWSTPTRDPNGWKTPCYLLTDGYCRTFTELMEETPWGKYGVGRDPRCANCMVHSGYEASALDEALKSLPEIWRMVKWSLLTG